MERVTTESYGICRDILLRPVGQVLDERGWVRNTIVDSCRVSLAGFTANKEPEKTCGIQCLAVERRRSEWGRNGILSSVPAVNLQLEDSSPEKILLKQLDLEYLVDHDEKVD